MPMLDNQQVNTNFTTKHDKFLEKRQVLLPEHPVDSLLEGPGVLTIITLLGNYQELNGILSQQYLLIFLS